MLVSEKSLYDVLGLRRSCSESEVRSAYRHLAARYHPDRNPGEAERFNQINQAYLTLCDPEKRRDYDRTLPKEERDEPTLGDRIEAALKAGLRRKPASRPRTKPLRAEKVHPPGKSLPYGHFSDWVKKKLQKEFGRGISFSRWEPRVMAASDFVSAWIEPYGFLIRPEVLEELDKKWDDDERPKAFFVDARGQGEPRIWGKHRAVVAARRMIRIEVYIRVS